MEGRSVALESRAAGVAAPRAALPPFQSFMEAHRREVYAFLLAVAGRDEADDCFQETFLAALRAYPRVGAGSNLRAWVMTIAARKAIDASRRRARRPVPASDAAGRAESAGHEAASIALDGASSLDGALWRSVESLPPKQRVAVVQRYVLDLPYSEIAVVLDCSEEAARANAYQGIQRLRKRWRDANE